MRRKWSYEEENVLIELFPDTDLEVLALILKRPACSIKERAYKLLGLRRRNPKKTWKRWSEEEIEFLKANYHKMSVREIAKALGRTRSSIIWKAGELGLTLRLPFILKSVIVRSGVFESFMAEARC